MIRIGAVSYLNTKPLIFGLEHQHRVSADLRMDFELSLDLPSRLAEQLNSGRLDVALVPIVETFRHPDWSVISDACIACEGPVWSVKLLSRVPLEQVGSVSLDEGSRTSAAMVRVMLSQAGRHDVEFRNLPIDADWTRTDSDAVLIIGDRAMDCSSGCFTHHWDLGQWWYDEFELPFVFAAWAVAPAAKRDPATTGPLAKLLGVSRDLGCQRLPQIADANAADYGLSNQRCLEYLRDYLKFRLGPMQISGIERFRELSKPLIAAEPTPASLASSPSPLKPL